MLQAIEAEFPVFLSEGGDAIGAVREVGRGSIVIFVENAGDIEIAAHAVRAVHDKKVIVDPAALDPKTMEAIRHRHDREDPNVAG